MSPREKYRLNLAAETAGSFVDFYDRDRLRADLSIKNLFDVEFFEAAVSDLEVFPGEPLTVQRTIYYEFWHLTPALFHGYDF